MRKSTGIFLIFLLFIAMIFMAGCTSSGPTSATPTAIPTKQIVYMTVFETPTDEVNPEVTAPTMSQNETMDEAFVDYIYEKQILEGITELTSASRGEYDISSGYNAEPKRKAENLTALLVNSPKPGSEKMKAFRSAMMDAVSMMDGTTAGFTRYREAMKVVTDTKFAVLSERPPAGFSVEPTQFYGYGNDVRSFNSTGTGKKYFTMTHTGQSNFAIILKDESERYIALLVNNIGFYSGKKSANLTIGKYYLDVTADGAWTIEISSD